MKLTDLPLKPHLFYKVMDAEGRYFSQNGFTHDIEISGYFESMEDILNCKELESGNYLIQTFIHKP